MASPAPAAIVGASAISAFGVGWRGLGRALRDGALAPAVSSQLSASHPGTLSSEVAAIPAQADVGDQKSRRLMSRSAHLAAVAMRAALEEASWSEGRDMIGCFLGLGASGGPMEELGAMLKASVRDGKIDPARFCREGLAAAHPLLAFHLLGNFTLCHGSIAAGVGGPNRAFYSRGAGTVTALSEAMWSLAEGDCDRALAGGADSGLHLATFVELHLEGFIGKGLVPGEGAAWLALAKSADKPLATLEACVVGRDAARVWEQLGGADLAVIAPWGPPARKELESVKADVRVDLFLGLGDPLAAGVALGCAAALDLLVAREAASAIVLCAGVDGEIGGVKLCAGGAL